MLPRSSIFPPAALVGALAILTGLRPVPCRASPGAPGAAVSVRGAIYVPAKAYNAPQMWRDFDRAETERDLGYAQRVHLNALRIWASYEDWRSEPARFRASFDALLETAHQDGIGILVSLFENDGIEPTPENMRLTDSEKAAAIRSPGSAIAKDRALWGPPEQFVRWFMDTYGTDKRLLAIELMNEPQRGGPRAPATVPFAQAIFSIARQYPGHVPLTIGFAKIDTAEAFYSLGLELIEVHDNFPADPAAFAANLKNSLAVGRKHGLPVWLTEWQRFRPSGTGWESQPLTDEEKLPRYAPAAAVVAHYEVGSFFWSLMIKRAYLLAQRKQKTINGLFWEDGAVWSLEDARAIAGDPSLQMTERKSLPTGFP